MKVVVSPNSFKGSLSATQAASAIARGVREVFPDAEIVEIPVADGGDGTVEALAQGEPGAVESAIAWCRRGPPGARVTDVEVAEVEVNSALKDFGMLGT